MKARLLSLSHELKKLVGLTENAALRNEGINHADLGFLNHNNDLKIEKKHSLF
jgi:hypothetical protein